MKKKAKSNIVRERILSLLKNPMNVTELKKELGDISSFGTIDYHLKILLSEGRIKKKKDTKKQGQPTLYYLPTLKNTASVLSYEEILETWEEWKKNTIIMILKELEKGEIETDILEDKIEKKLGDKYMVDEFVSITLDSDLVEVILRITEKGKKYLRENDLNATKPTKDKGKKNKEKSNLSTANKQKKHTT